MQASSLLHVNYYLLNVHFLFFKNFVYLVIMSYIIINNSVLLLISHLCFKAKRASSKNCGNLLF